jgi:PAS domain-containing protein
LKPDAPRAVESDLMAHDHSHTDLMDELAAHFGPLLENSKDGVYLWLDGDNAICNEKLAKLFGTTVAEWCKPGSFLDRFVDPKDHDLFGGNYQDHVANLSGPVRFTFRARRKDGSAFAAETDMIPISFGGHAVAYHFVRPAQA